VTGAQRSKNDYTTWHYKSRKSSFSATSPWKAVQSSSNFYIQELYYMMLKNKFQLTVKRISSDYKENPRLWGKFFIVSIFINCKYTFRSFIKLLSDQLGKKIQNWEVIRFTLQWFVFADLTVIKNQVKWLEFDLRITTLKSRKSSFSAINIKLVVQSSLNIHRICTYSLLYDAL